MDGTYLRNLENDKRRIESDLKNVQKRIDKFKKVEPEFHKILDSIKNGLENHKDTVKWIGYNKDKVLVIDLNTYMDRNVLKDWIIDVTHVWREHIIINPVYETTKFHIGLSALWMNQEGKK